MSTTFTQEVPPQDATRDGRPLHVMKFGGTSVGSPTALRQAVHLIQGAAACYRVVVTVSAAAGVTDLLVQAADTSHTNASGWLDHLEHRYRTLAALALETTDAKARYRRFLGTFLNGLRHPLQGTTSGDGTLPFRHRVLALGERLMAPLLALALQEVGLHSMFVDAARLVRVGDGSEDVVVDRNTTYRQIRAWYCSLPLGTVPVVPGFIGGTAAGDTVTLGRGGSDYSAALFAAALQADLLERWTDVDGLYTDDPRTNQRAERLEAVALHRAAAWNRAGRLGMHRRALDPLIETGIPVRVRSTHRPDAPGTCLFPVEAAAA